MYNKLTLKLLFRQELPKPFINQQGGSKMAEKGYCVKCKDKKEMKNEEKVTMKNGRSAVKGKCSTCGTGMYKILGK
jgi:hypothetical protein